MIGTPREQVLQLTKYLHAKGYLPGLAGGVALLSQKSENHKTIILTPDNVHKGSLKSGDLFEMKWIYDKQDFVTPSLKRNGEIPQIARWSQLYMSIFSLTKATCILECATPWASLASRLAMRSWERNATSYPNKLRLANWELLDRIGLPSDTVVPIIERQHLDAMQLELNRLFIQDPNMKAILVRDYGLLVWENSIDKALCLLETLDALCELQIKEFRLLGRL